MLLPTKDWAGVVHTAEQAAQGWIRAEWAVFFCLLQDALPCSNHAMLCKMLCLACGFLFVALSDLQIIQILPKQVGVWFCITISFASHRIASQWCSRFHTHTFAHTHTHYHTHTYTHLHDIHASSHKSCTHHHTHTPSHIHIYIHETHTHTHTHTITHNLLDQHITTPCVQAHQCCMHACCPNSFVDTFVCINLQVYSSMFILMSCRVLSVLNVVCADAL